MSPDVNSFSLWPISYDSPVVDLGFELEELRAYRPHGTTPDWLFFQLKDILHSAESLMSLRLEGNTTEIVEYAQARQYGDFVKEPIKEISNYEKALTHIMRHLENEGDIDGDLICTLHEIVVDGLTPVQAGGDGDMHPGQYSFIKEEGIRRVGSETTGKYHYPPVFPDNAKYMQRLFEFIETDHGKKYDAIKIGQAHQHFAWVHPFNNGNGRVGRLLTHAMLIKANFSVAGLLTPSSIFCGDRSEYNARLSACDDLSNNIAKEEWLVYVLGGIVKEFKKVTNLMDFDFVKKHILLSAINGAYEHGKIEQNDHRILKCVYHLESFKTGDTADLELASAYRSRLLGGMLEKGLIKKKAEKGRIYQVNYLHPQLMYGVLKALEYQRMLPPPDQMLARAISKERTEIE